MQRDARFQVVLNVGSNFPGTALLRMRRMAGIRPSCRNVPAAAFVTSGFLLQFAAIGTNARSSLIPPPAKKNQSPFPRPTSRCETLDGALVWDFFMPEAP